MMTETTRTPGKTTISAGVLQTIADLTTLSVEGVSRLSPASPRVNRLLSRSAFSRPAHVSIIDNLVYVDLHVILKEDVNIRQISRDIQDQVARAITDMVGMNVGKINIHIEDIDFSPEG